MPSLSPSVRVFVAAAPAPGRKGFDSLAAIVRSAFRHDPPSGHPYVFFSRRCDRVRIVYGDRNGFAMWTKRLERGRFHTRFREDARLAVSAIETAELGLILEGIDLSGVRRRPRWEPPSASSEIVRAG